MSKQKKVTWTPAKMREYEEEITGKTITLVLATLMDEYDFDKEDLERFAERFCRYNTAVKEHLITLGKVVDIVFDTTGVRIHW